MGENNQNTSNSNDDFVFGAEEEPDDDLDDLNAVFAGRGAFGNPEHYDEDDESNNDDFYLVRDKIGCDDCVFGLCDCGYDFD
ncbi:MAG: hypothetical protein FWF76_00450 [Oscillospiraceae bacterium]|nr:hypothetical protein [Oscillospiraceae bacterium]